MKLIGYQKRTRQQRRAQWDIATMFTNLLSYGQPRRTPEHNQRRLRKRLRLQRSHCGR